MLQNEFYAKLETARQKQDTLMHYGTLGQKWGVRHWQYKDGTYTKAGLERYFGSKRKDEKVDDDELSNSEYEKQKEKIGICPELAAAALTVGIVGATIGVEAIHDSIITRQIRNYEKHRETEKTDKNTGLKLKSDPDASIKDDMKFINREFKYTLFALSGMAAGSTENCMLCTTALDLKRRGYDVKAGKVSEGFYATDIKKWYKTEPQINMNKFDNLMDMIKKEPEGSYGNFMVYWAEGGGHSMFYRIENGKPVIYDAQSNKKYSIGTIRSHANRSIPGTCYVRLDNLEPNYNYLKVNKLIS